MRFKKVDTSELSLGPSSRPGAWAKGASGGGGGGGGAGTRSGSAGGGREEQRGGNRFGALTDSDSSFDDRGGRGGGRNQGKGGEKIEIEMINQLINLI